MNLKYNLDLRPFSNELANFGELKDQNCTDEPSGILLQFLTTVNILKQTLNYLNYSSTSAIIVLQMAGTGELP